MPVTLAMLDATLPDNAALATRFGVTGYPTLKMFRDHSAEGVVEYTGGRDADGIVAFLTKQTGPVSMKLESAAEAAALVQKEEIVIVRLQKCIALPVLHAACAACSGLALRDSYLRTFWPAVFSHQQFGVLPEGSDAEAQMAFLFVAASLRNDYVFAHVTDGALLPFGGVPDTSGPQAVMYKKYDNPFVMTSDLSANALRAWVHLHAQPRVVRLRSNDSKHKAALKHIHEAKVPRVFAFGAFDGDVPADAPILAAVEAAAVAHPELKFVVGDAALNPDTVTHFGLTTDDLPAAVVHDVTSGQKVYTQPRITQDGLAAFISDFKAGALVPNFKSEPLPNNNGMPVTTLVANNFEAVVGRRAAAGKTILIMFYTTWCSFCQMLAPVYEEVGEHFAGRNDVIIAKMDAEANSMTDDRYKSNSVPTVFLQTASGAASEFEGDYTKEEMIALVEQHAALAGDDILKSDAVATELQAEL